MTTEEIIASGLAVNFNKLFRFQGSHFKRRQRKTVFFLTTKKFANVFKEDIDVMKMSSTHPELNNNGKPPMESDVYDPDEKEKQHVIDKSL